jgi:hypothetical protein
MGGHDHDEKEVVSQYRPMIVKTASNARTIRFNVLLYKRSAENDRARNSTEYREHLWSYVRSYILNRVFNTTTYSAAQRAPRAIRELIVPAEERGMPGPSARSARAFLDDTRLRSGFVPFGDYDVGIFSFALDTESDAVIGAIPEYKKARDCIEKWERRWDSDTCGSRSPSVVLTATFHARDGMIRKQSTNMGNFAVDALTQNEASARVAEVGLLNSGSLRIDRDLRSGVNISANSMRPSFLSKRRVSLFAYGRRAMADCFEKSVSARARRCRMTW